jgi:hypothetical protein
MLGAVRCVAALLKFGSSSTGRSYHQNNRLGTSVHCVQYSTIPSSSSISLAGWVKWLDGFGLQIQKLSKTMYSAGKDRFVASSLLH